MREINVEIMPYELSARAYQWYCSTDLSIKMYEMYDELFVMNGVRYDSYEEVLDMIEAMAEEFERIEKEWELRMTPEDAIKYLIAPVKTSTKSSVEYRKQMNAYLMAVEALNRQHGKKTEDVS